MFGQPTFGSSGGDRNGTTVLNGSLAPVIMPGFMTRLAADIMAYPPFGVIATTVSAGFIAGIAPPGASMITTILSGIVSMNRSVAETAGGFAATACDVSIRVEEWTISIAGPRPHRVRRFVRAIDFNPTEITHLWTVGLGVQLETRDNQPIVSAAGMPVVPGRQYVIIANLEQSAQYDLGAGAAVSNIVFDFPPMFFAFT